MLAKLYPQLRIKINFYSFFNETFFVGVFPKQMTRTLMFINSVILKLLNKK